MIQAVQQAAQRIDTRAALAAEILAQFQMLTTKLSVPIEQFNDDDYYVYCPLTLELVKYIGSRKHFVPPPLVCAKGMAVKHLGLWRAA